MNRTARWGFALALLPIAACSSNTPAPMAATPPAPPPLAQVDQTFITNAAQGGMAEVQAAQLALTKARSARVKAYANEMLADHTPVNQQLMQLAQQKGVTPPPSVNDMQQQQMAMLQGETGARFDRDYMRAQVTDHQMMVQMFQDEAANGQDPDLKALATSTIPVIQKHLMQARQATGMHAPAPMHHTAAKASGSNM